MDSRPTIDVIIPAFNEAESVALVIKHLPKLLIRNIVVADNNSTDNTAAVTRDAGAIVVPARRQGYGAACLAGLAYLSADPPEIVVFIDADFSDDPAELPLLIAPLIEGRADLVIGSRTLKPQPADAFTPQQYFGNKLACFLMRWLFAARFTDLGPFRAITWEALSRLHMSDPNYGWTVEMQIKAARLKLRAVEIAVNYRPRRFGVSKVSGSLTGTLRAGYKILYLIFRYGFFHRSLDSAQKKTPK
ncbi:MAG: glycosyltransferase family 2 protein [Burkholderiales bacterium]|nr:glycosyltransferase family 2 protein [Phycisphaerae bacterium]